MAPERNNQELNILQQLSKAQLTGALMNQLQPLAHLWRPLAVADGEEFKTQPGCGKRGFRCWMWDTQTPESQLVGQSRLEEALASGRGKAAPTGHHTRLLGRNAPDFFRWVTEQWGWRSRRLRDASVSHPASAEPAPLTLNYREGGCRGMELPESWTRAQRGLLPRARCKRRVDVALRDRV